MNIDDIFKQQLKEYRSLKDLVGHIRDNFKVGQNLSAERELRDVMGYSRPTMRESLIRLQCFGFISRQHGKPMVYLKQL